MKLVIDTHTHTISSGHAYSTISENAVQARINGMQAIAMTDHGPALMGAPTTVHFMNLRVIPEYIDGVRIFRGAETDIMDFTGRLDIPDNVLSRLEFVIASFHDIVIKPGDIEQNTEGMINALKNPFVDAVAHPGNPVFQVDIEKVVRTAAEYGKLIELNNGSARVRKGSLANCLEFARMCKKHGVTVTCGTDAHICYDIGKFNSVMEILDEAGMYEDLVMCSSLGKAEDFVSRRKTAKQEAYSALKMKQQTIQQ